MPPTLKEKILDVLFPPRCSSCFREGVFLCEECFRAIPVLPSVQCPICERRIPEGEVCVRCRGLSGMHRFVAASSYDHPIVSQAIHDMKYRFVRDLAFPLGVLLSDAIWRYWKKSMPADCAILALPLAKQRLRWRGFNQSILLAEYIAKKFGCPLLASEGPAAVLKRRKHSKPQILLARAEREKNVQGVFVVRHPEILKRKVILLVDDVMTSGATLFEAAKTLRRAGVKEVWGAVVARG